MKFLTSIANQKICGRKGPWPNLRHYYQNNCAQQLRKAIKISLILVALRAETATSKNLS
jgi:hypothetical protein